MSVSISHAAGEPVGHPPTIEPAVPSTVPVDDVHRKPAGGLPPVPTPELLPAVVNP